jgi:hypothetical protein
LDAIASTFFVNRFRKAFATASDSFNVLDIYGLDLSFVYRDADRQALGSREDVMRTRYSHQPITLAFQQLPDFVKSHFARHDKV